LRAVEFAPEDAQSHWALALVFFFQKELKDFSSSADQALKLAPNDVDMIANVGFKLVISGSDWDGGVELMDQAMQMSPAHPPLWYFPRALFEYRRHAYEDALAAANRVNIPKLYMSHMFRAMILGQLGKTEDAKRAAEEIIKLKPDFSKNVRSDLRRRNIPEEMINHMLDGLRKAGLQIPSK
jgi:tetratricopeptide (TPR) repeat protein